MKSFAKLLMYFTGLYALIGYIFLMLWFIGVLLNLLLGEISLFPNILTNMIILLESFLQPLTFIGLVVLFILVGQFFFAYHASIAFKRLSEIENQYTKKDKYEFFMYLFFLLMIIIFIW